MEIQLFWVALIVSVGPISVQPNNALDPDRHGIRDTFRNFFNSINKNEQEKTEGDRRFLEQEAAREKQAFDAMKEEWRSTRQRNVHEQQNLNHRKVAALKREAAKPTEGTSLRPLPEETDSFETIRKQNKTYVDKTPFLMNLLNMDEVFFYLARPPNFGKSTFLQMVRNFFAGEKHLFEGLTVYEQGNTEGKANGTWVRYPVIYLDFSAPKYLAVTSREEFKTTLYDELIFIGQAYGVDPVRKANSTLSSLMKRLHVKFRQPIIILIDEYDTPMRRASSSELAKEIHVALRGFCWDVETCSIHVRLMLMVGVTKPIFGKGVSDLYALEDMTDESQLAAACGFSKPEISAYFEPHIQQFVRATNLTRKAIMKDLIDWYGGYRFALNETAKLLNPSSVLACLKEQRFGKFWCGDQLVRHTLNVLPKRWDQIDDFQDYIAKRDDLFAEYDEQGEGVPWYVLLLFTGYFSIKSYNATGDEYTIGFPNRETKEALSDRMCSYIVSEKKYISELPEWTAPLKGAMQDGNFSAIMEVLARFDFPIWDVDKTESVRGMGRMRRLLRIFDAAGIEYKLGAENWRQFHVDVQTLHLPVNYVVEVRAMEQALEAMYLLIDFIMRRTEFFNNAIDNQDEVYLWTMDFTKWGTDELAEWLFVPYTHGEVRYERLMASKKILADNLRFRISQRQNVTERPVNA